jgi:hypothetical protein
MGTRANERWRDAAGVRDRILPERDRGFPCGIVVADAFG